MEGRNLLLRETGPETAGWKGVLGFLQQENILQKNKLAELLKSNGEKNENLLEIAEQYQYQFIQQDEAFRFIWNDLAELERSSNEKAPNNDDDAKICNRREKLRREIASLQIHFDNLKSHFLHFLETFSENN